MRARAGQHGARASLLVLFVFAAPVHAQLVTPYEPVSPDGFEVHSKGLLTAEGATVSRRGAASYFVVPATSAREVRLFEGGRVRTLKVGPPAATVSLAVTPALPVKNRDRSAQLDITVGGDSAPPLVRVNVGSVGPLEVLGDGHFRATYTLPQTRFPEVAVIVAFAAWPHAQSIHGASGVVRVPLASAVEVTGRAEAGSVVRLTIAGKTWGPVRTAPDGNFRLPVEVPPGYGTAQSRAIDRVGNSRTTSVDLMLPPTNQLACAVTPDHLPADGVSQARVICATSDRYGSSVRGAGVSLVAAAGTLSSGRDLGDRQEWTWTAPRDRGAGVTRLSATWRSAGVTSSDALIIRLEQGPVVALAERDVPEVVHLGSTWKAEFLGLDSLGQPLSGMVASVELPGSRAFEADGGLQVAWTPVGEPRIERVTVRVWGPTGTEPARLLAWLEGDSFAVGVTDLLGRPIASQRLLLDGQVLETGPEGTAEAGVVADGEHELRHAQWPALRVRLVVQGGQLIYPLTNRPARVEFSRDLTVGPAVPLNVRIARTSDGFDWWLEDSQGAVLDGHPVALSVDGVASRGVSRGRQHVVALRLTVVELSTMVGALGAPP